MFSGLDETTIRNVLRTIWDQFELFSSHGYYQTLASFIHVPVKCFQTHACLKGYTCLKKHYIPLLIFCLLFKQLEDYIAAKFINSGLILTIMAVNGLKERAVSVKGCLTSKGIPMWIPVLGKTLYWNGPLLGHLNIKMLSYKYWDSHYKDKTVLSL